MREIDKEYAFEDGYNAAANESKGGDLISREALKKAVYAEFGNNNLTDTFNDIIANAPSVEPEITNDDLQAAMTESYRLGYELAETKFKRPQGEWLIVKDEKYGDNVKCPFCGKEIAGSDLNYCVKCGADMRKGGAE